MNTRTGGFTIVEILVSILILGLLMAVLSALLMGSLKMNQQSQKQVNTTSEAQRIMEDIRNSWATQSNYDNACAPGVVVPDGYNAKFINLSTRAEPVTLANDITVTITEYAISNTVKTASATAVSCTKATGAQFTSPSGTPPTMRRIKVSSGTGAQDTILTLDVLRPQE